MINTGKLAGKTVFISGASRGIGKEIALKVARDGANVIIAAKTATAHPKLPGTIYTAAEEVEKAGGKALPIVVDIRDEAQIQNAIDEGVKKFGGIDILVNNASAISLTKTEDTDMKRFDLMHGINLRGTFLVSKLCLPHLKKSSHAHILNLSPPLSMKPFWFSNHVAYTMAKYGMSMCVLGMHEEFRSDNIAVNALWPRTAIYTAAMAMLSGADSAKFCRKAEIIADAAYGILTEDPKKVTGNFFVDEDYLRSKGVTDFDQYLIDPSCKDQLLPDFFLDDVAPKQDGTAIGDKHKASTGKVGLIFKKIEASLSQDLVKNTQAVYQFVLTGNEAGKWFLDLKTGQGNCGQGDSPSSVDSTLSMNSDHFFDMFSGKLKPASAYMMGKLKISGNLNHALKLEKLMRSLKAKL